MEPTDVLPQISHTKPPTMETQNAEHTSSDTLSLRQPHHHHHHQILLPCHHQQHHQHNRLPSHHNHHHHLVMLPHFCAVHGFAPPPNGPLFQRPIVPQTSAHLQASFDHQENHSSRVFEQVDAYEELEEEEEEEPVFVLTDEWANFFAKSEAKRREAKKKARKQGKK